MKGGQVTKPDYARKEIGYSVAINWMLEIPILMAPIASSGECISKCVDIV